MSRVITGASWSDIPGATVAETRELGRFVAMRSKVFEVPWKGSVRVGSAMCCVRPKLLKRSKASL